MFKGQVAGRIGKIEINDKGTRAIVNVASNQKVNGDDVTNWARLTVFGDKLIEKVIAKLAPGTIVSATFDIRNNNYTDKDGNKQYGQDFIVDQIDVLLWPAKQEGREERRDDAPASTRGSTKGRQTNKRDFAAELEDDVPF